MSQSPSRLSPASQTSPPSQGSRPPSSKPPARTDDLALTVKRIDGQERMTFRFKCNKRITIGQIKERVNEEWGIATHEQVLIFRGQRAGEDNRAMPLNTPDLAEVVKEAGEKGLQFAVMYLPRKLPAFLEREGLETVSSKRKTMATGLHRASRRSELSVMEEILNEEEFEEADAVDNAGQTALHAAVATRNRPACEILLNSKKFSNSNAADQEGRTVLHIAASWGDALVVRWIVEHWQFKVEDVNAEDCFGRTALEYARDCGHAQAVELIAKAAEAPPESTEAPAESPAPAAEPEGAPPEPAAAAAAAAAGASS